MPYTLIVDEPGNHSDTAAVARYTYGINAYTGAIPPLVSTGAVGDSKPHCATCRCDGASDVGTAPDLGSATNPESDSAT